MCVCVYVCIHTYVHDCRMVVEGHRYYANANVVRMQQVTVLGLSVYPSGCLAI